MRLLLGDEFSALFTSFDRTARRLEVRERYNVAEEHSPVAAFLAGRPHDLAWFAPWLEQVRVLSAAGKRFRRVRVVSLPLSGYNQWGLQMARHTSAAGEDIRYLDRARAGDLPDFDYWLFDDSWAAKLHFDADDRPLGAEVITSPDLVMELASALTVAESLAVPLEHFADACGPR